MCYAENPNMCLSEQALFVDVFGDTSQKLRYIISDQWDLNQFGRKNVNISNFSGKCLHPV